MRLFGIALLLFAGFTLGASSACADPITTLDQSNVGVVDGGFTIPFSAAVGQGFTPTLTGLDAVELWLNKQSDADGSVFVRIRDGGIAGAILGTSNTKTITGTPGAGTSSASVHFDFASTVALTAGSLYVIEAVHAGGGDLGVLGFGFGGDPYSGGNAYFMGDARPDDDLWFKEGLHSSRAGPVPEPGSLALLAGALLTMGLIRRRRRAGG